jgi:hypothetical protein
MIKANVNIMCLETQAACFLSIGVVGFTNDKVFISQRRSVAQVKELSGLIVQELLVHRE